jgi:hypothetical protein
MVKLPLKLKVTGVRRDDRNGAITVETLVTDAAGVTLYRRPLTVGAQQTAASITAILQSDIKSIAESMHKRDEVLPEDAGGDSTDLEPLVGKEFLGSVVLT